ncbi:MAG: tRNA (adenosine(37)-N6)-threonylcarbamoyltransferase complex dimerization subunit type 1 TsaB, partial [Planctomycetes bacterium]|nr:tRNA (adenosine(37)-N6)-threonylcarbamoyltransferase complex dimerization subunit type 1 TsaB [Planctomycetota bacterium]
MNGNTGLSQKSLNIAVETSGRAGSVAIGFGNRLSEEKTFSGNMRHNAELFETIIELLQRVDKSPSQIGQIYISAGPGSFTGLRIAVTLAKTMALANNAKIVAVNSLDVLAENASANTDNADFTHIRRIAAIID